ncbi:pentapeptide repeat-containing protein [Actinomycetospora chibensis]|uniref:Pentapeptide repeat-containing protein n=1 Tax=Actinomycetospora chibensis TaxID=663606 RepID=A0ABV9RMX0_9PSEU
MDVRLGGIYGFARLAQDSPRDQAAIVEVLGSYIRDRLPSVGTPECAPAAPPSFLMPEDLTTAMYVMSRRDRRSDDGARVILDGLCHPPVWEGADLRGFSFNSANLVGAKFLRTDLTRGEFDFANLTNANLIRADLTRAVLRGAVLRGADLRGADLKAALLIGADLSGANLTDADLTDADLTGANLTGANLTGADLTGADLPPP